MINVPDFDDLPPVEGLPQGCAWGVFDKGGQKDKLGTLNFLTPEVVQAAANEVKHGIPVSLNWSMNGMDKITASGRKHAVHNFLSLDKGGFMSCSGWDDEVEFNTQCSSQWDSLAHYHHQPTKLAYNGVECTQAALEEAAAAKTAGNALPTLDHWHARGCLVGRGVLIDFKQYADDVGIDFLATGGYRITTEELERAAAHQGVEFQPGDILLVRTGFTESVDAIDPDQIRGSEGIQLSGVHGTEDTAKWLWNKRFAAAASDSAAFEAFPPLKPDGSVTGMDGLVLHQYMLSLFGMPIGELWDLKRLSEECKKAKKYSFMLTSAPMNVACLVASPPNAVAIL